ncbi:hypothetical protein D3C81_2295650 [compost metagenome]
MRSAVVLSISSLSQFIHQLFDTGEAFFGQGLARAFQRQGKGPQNRCFEDETDRHIDAQLAVDT